MNATAMTGGQHVDGELSPQQITFQLHSEGIRNIYLVSETPEAYPASDIAPGVKDYTWSDAFTLPVDVDVPAGRRPDDDGAPPLWPWVQTIATTRRSPTASSTRGSRSCSTPCCWSS